MGDIDVIPVELGEFAAGKVRAAEVCALHVCAGPAVFPQFAFLQNDVAEVGVAEVIFGLVRLQEGSALDVPLPVLFPQL